MLQRFSEVPHSEITNFWEYMYRTFWQSPNRNFAIKKPKVNERSNGQNGHPQLMRFFRKPLCIDVEEEQYGENYQT